MNMNTATYQEVKSALDNWSDSYIKRDIKHLLSCVAPDIDVVMYGTGADEKRIGLNEIRTQAERDWSQTESAAFIFEEPNISAVGSVSWVSADCSFRVVVGGGTMAFPGRFTGVFEKRDNKWLIVQAHFSLPAMQDEGESVPHD